MTALIELVPTVSRCIEAVAKREYWKSVDEYLKKRKGDRELEQKIELLRSFSRDSGLWYAQKTIGRTHPGGKAGEVHPIPQRGEARLWNDRGENGAR